MLKEDWERGEGGVCRGGERERERLNERRKWTSERHRQQEKPHSDDDELMLNVLRCHLTY